MKLAKYFILMLLIALCFCMGGEIFQSYSETFTDKYYFIDIILPDDETAITVADIAKSYGSEAFAAITGASSPHRNSLSIYGTEGALSEISSDLCMKGGTAESMFSGATDIELFNISELGADEAGVTFWFSGDKNTVSDIRLKLIKTGVTCSYLHKNTPSSNRWLLPGLWSAAAAFILFLTWMDIQFQKKKAFVRISLGESVYTIILRNILLDLAVYTLIFIIERTIISRFVFTGFRFGSVLWISIGTALINSVLYLTMAKYDYKEVMYGANIRQSILSNSYLIKAALMLLIIISLSENAVLVKSNYRFIDAYSKIGGLTEYESVRVKTANAFINAEDHTDSFEEMQSNDDAVALAQRRFFLEAYSESKVLLSVSFAELDEPILYVNKTAVEALASDASFIKTSDKNFVVYIPESKRETITRSDRTVASDVCALWLFGMREYTCETVYYEHSDMIYFDFQNGTILENGFDVISDPIMVLCNITPEKALLLAEETGEPHCFGMSFRSICFHSSASTNSLEECNAVKEISKTNIREQCFENRSRIMRAVILGTTISAFLCVFCLLISGAAVRAEYMINSKRIALKRIFGYGIVSRNRNAVLFNAVTVIIGMATAAILSVSLKIAPLWTIVLSGTALLLVDLFLVTVMMAEMERKNTACVLKGGCL